jgi:hypothetical protein
MDSMNAAMNPKLTAYQDKPHMIVCHNVTGVTLRVADQCQLIIVPLITDNITEEGGHMWSLLHLWHRYQFTYLHKYPYIYTHQHQYKHQYKYQYMRQYMRQYKYPYMGLT